MKAGNSGMGGPRILVVEDRAGMRQMLVDTLTAEGYRVTAAASGEAGLEKVRRDRFDLVLTDLEMPGLSGLDLLRQARDHDPFLPVVLLTAFGTVETAVQAMKEGAHDFLTKPVDGERLVLVAERALEKRKLATDNALLERELGERLEQPVLYGDSPAIRSLLAVARKAARTDATVLVLGESGTGKELLARFVHTESPRAVFPLVVINCATIPRDLIENELFGSEKGAYTGADRRKVGRIELADRGTVFLDEIGDLPFDLQPKLLRLIQERQFERVGGTKSLAVDVRIVAATNKNLVEEVRQGRFREDLYYRLNVVPLELPPLRAREGDAATLARAFVVRLAREMKRREARLSDAALAKITAYSWPGNVRELRNTIERALILAEGEEIGPEAIVLVEGAHPEPVLALVAAPAGEGLAATKKDLVRRVEIDSIRKALQESGGNKAEAARRLRLSYRSLWAKVKEYGLD